MTRAVLFDLDGVLLDSGSAVLATLAGVATGLVTLQSRTRLPWLVPSAALALLDVTVCREDAEPKPAPDGLLLALTRLGAGWGYAEPAVLKAAGAVSVLDDAAGIGPGLLDFALAHKR